MESQDYSQASEVINLKKQLRVAQEKYSKSVLEYCAMSDELINQSIKLFILEKKKKVPSNTFTERETQEKEETTQRQSVKTGDMKIVIHTKKNKNNTHGRDT